MELVRGGTSEWYWATDYIHGDLYEAEELFRQKNSVQSNRLYLIHYPDGMVYEPVLPVGDLDALYQEIIQSISPILALLSEKRASAIRQYLKYRLHYLKAAMG